MHRDHQRDVVTMVVDTITAVDKMAIQASEERTMEKAGEAPPAETGTAREARWRARDGRRHRGRPPRCGLA